jgi:hypothetical protein
MCARGSVSQGACIVNILRELDLLMLQQLILCIARFKPGSGLADDARRCCERACLILVINFSAFHYLTTRESKNFCLLDPPGTDTDIAFRGQDSV